jgi:hypothetical protein
VSERTRTALILATCTIAALLASAVHAPAGARSFPRTLARSVTRAPGTSRAALSFPATHVAFTWTGDPGTGVRYRALDGAGQAGRWRVAPEAHDMAHGRRHYSGVISVDRPTSIEWESIVPRRADMGQVTLDYLNTVDGPRVAAPRSPSPARAREPSIVTRAQWGADESIKRTTRGCTREFFKVQQLFVHHTAGSNYDLHPKATMRAIYWYHTVRRGWCDIGYNFVIGWNGQIYEGRWARRYRPWELHSSEDVLGRAARGAHVENFNSGSVGMSLMGNFSTVPLPARMRATLVRLLAWEADRHNLLPMGTHMYRNPETGLARRLPFIAGHRDAGHTACPGGNVYTRLPAIRRAVNAAIGAGRSNSSVALDLALPTITFGSRTRASGRLARRGGATLPRRPVELWTRTPAVPWRLTSTLVTTTDGSFSRRIAPRANTTVVAVWRGGPASWPGQSRRRRVAVRPRVSIVPEGVESASDGVFVYPPGTTAVGLSGAVRPPHPGRRVTVRVNEVRSDGSIRFIRKDPARLSPASRYRYTFVRPHPGATYRAVARIARDRDNAPGASAPVTFAIGGT